MWCESHTAKFWPQSPKLTSPNSIRRLFSVFDRPKFEQGMLAHLPHYALTTTARFLMQIHELPNTDLPAWPEACKYNFINYQVGDAIKFHARAAKTGGELFAHFITAVCVCLLRML